MATMNLFPVFNHLGYFNGSIQGKSSGYCECNASSIFSTQCNSKTFACQHIVSSFYICGVIFFVFKWFAFIGYSFVTGFIFYNFEHFTADGLFNVKGATQGSDNYVDLSVKYKNNLVGLNRDGFDACKESSVRGLSTDQASRDSIYKFCTGSFETRHIVIRI